MPPTGIRPTPVQLPFDALRPTARYAVSGSNPPPTLFNPSDRTLTTPSSDSSTGIDGTLGGVTSDSTVTDTVPDHSPGLSL